MPTKYKTSGSGLDFFGIVSLMIVRNTIRARRSEIEYDILSPDSGGKRKTIKLIRLCNIIGMITMTITKYGVRFIF